MSSKISKQVFVLFVIFAYFSVASSLDALVCSSCGEECFDACGTRFFRTCCFNYLRKRSSAMQDPQLNLGYEENSIWMNKAELERMLHNEFSHQPNFLHQKSTKKEDLVKPASLSNPEQMRGIYEE